MFILFGACSLIAAVFHGIWMKETKGLTDKEKKELYSGNVKGEDAFDEGKEDLKAIKEADLSEDEQSTLS